MSFILLDIYLVLLVIRSNMVYILRTNNYICFYIIVVRASQRSDAMRGWVQ